MIQLWLGKFGRKGGRIKNNIQALILKQEAPQQHRPVAFPARWCGSGPWREDRDSRFEEDEWWEKFQWDQCRWPLEGRSWRGGYPDRIRVAGEAFATMNNDSRSR
jgi:hypothetical protein